MENASQRLQVPEQTTTRAADDKSWSVVEMALVALGGALVLLFAGYFRGQATLARGFRAD